MDGYIKNKKAAISSIRSMMLWKYACTLVILIFIPVWLLALAVDQPPEKWTHTEIVFSHISRESVGIRRGYSNVINSADGQKFVVNAKYLSTEGLTAGNTYSLVYSGTPAGGDIVVALSDEDTVFLALEDSISRWDRNRSGLWGALAATIALEIAALALINRLWCKKERAQMAKLKTDIARRAQKTA